MALADFNLEPSAICAIPCAQLRFYAIDPPQLLHGAHPTRIVGSWLKIKAMIFMCGPDA